MKRESVERKGVINAELIDEYSEKTREYLLANGVSKRDAIRYALTVEEIMLKKGNMGKNSELLLERRFGRHTVELKIEGTAEDGIQKEEDEGFFGASLLRNLGLSPEYSYSDGKNVYRIKTRRKQLNPLLVLLITLLAAFGIGFAGKLLPDGFRTEMLEGLLDPVYSAFLGALTTIAGPMMFLSVVWGIYGIGDASTLKKVGKKVIGRYLLITLLGAVVTVAALPLYDLSFGSGTEGAVDLKSIVTLLLGIVPSNLVESFYLGNTLQIIFMAAVVGIAMLFLDGKTGTFAGVVEQLKNIMQLIIEVISKVVPLFIGISIISMIWKGNAFSVAGIGKTVAVMVLGTAAISTIILFITAAYNKISPRKLLKSILPILFIGLSTSSSVACFGNVVKCAERDLKIDGSLVSFSIPVGIVAYKPFVSLAFSLFMFYLAEYYGVQVSPLWVITVVITTTVFAISLVPIPGGMLPVYTLMFSQLGIPLEGIAILLACNAVLDLTVTGFDAATHPLVLLNSAKRLNMVKKTD